ncbi:MAG: septum site-determining protein MinC [Lachnospiraceae bacterium]|nr:septum site-determining protein MinC [Lachnospiraceae bacterium]
MNNAVVIKGTTYGFSVYVDEQAEFATICELVKEKFKESAKFFGAAKMAISFEGKRLSDEEQRELLNIIAANSEVQIVCVIEKNGETEELHRRSLEDCIQEQQLQALDSSNGQFYKGNLRSGQVLETETSIIIVGDVNQGATVTSKGNIIVLGALLGNVYAGAGGNENAFVLALELDPVQIRIADTIARAPDKVGKALWKREKEKTKEPKIAFRSGGNIFIEPVSRTVLNDIKL